jgi:hypothetical protein
MLVVALVILAACPTFHAWLHGEKALDADDDCAVVLFANGVTSAAATVAVAAFFICVWREAILETDTVFFREPRHRLPPECGPPVFLSETMD